MLSRKLRSIVIENINTEDLFYYYEEIDQPPYISANTAYYSLDKAQIDNTELGEEGWQHIAWLKPKDEFKDELSELDLLELVKTPDSSYLVGRVSMDVRHPEKNKFNAIEAYELDELVYGPQSYGGYKDIDSEDDSEDMTEDVNNNLLYDKDELEVRLHKAVDRLMHSREINIKAYEAALQEEIENMYPDKLWWEVTDCNIFMSLFNGRDPYATIDEILEGMDDGELIEDYEPSEEIERKTIDRELFASLVKVRKGEYDIMNDYNVVKTIFADSDDAAIREFRTYVNQNNPITEDVNNEAIDYIQKYWDIVNFQCATLDECDKAEAIIKKAQDNDQITIEEWDDLMMAISDQRRFINQRARRSNYKSYYRNQFEDDTESSEEPYNESASHPKEYHFLIVGDEVGEFLVGAPSEEEAIRIAKEEVLDEDEEFECLGTVSEWQAENSGLDEF